MSTLGWTHRTSNPAPILAGAPISSVDVMHEVINAVLIAAVVAFVIVRRFLARPIDMRKLWVLPVVIAVIGFAQGGAIDTRHTGLSAVLLAAEIVVAGLLGIGLGATMRVWRDTGGSAWSKGTWTTFGVFLLSIATRGGLVALGYAAGVHAGSAAIMVSAAVWLLAQNAVISWRVRALPTRVSVYP